VCRQTLPLNLRDLDTADNDIVFPDTIDVDSFPAKDTLIGTAVRITRKGNMVEQITGPACRTSRYSIEYQFKKFK
jgi:hypothetical protein